MLNRLKERDLEMYNRKPRLFLRKNVTKWNNTAIDCYEINSDCNRCLLYKLYFKNSVFDCHMWEVVQYLLKKYGEPDIEKYM